MVFQYQILSHPADVKLQITASTKEELFQGALAGMASIIQSQIPRKAPIIKENIEIQALDLNTLLVDFLNEVLAKTDIYNCVFDGIKIEKLTDNYIKGRIEGKNVKEFFKEIKAATYHELNVIQDKKGIWKAVILFDI